MFKLLSSFSRLLLNSKNSIPIQRWGLQRTLNNIIQPISSWLPCLPIPLCPLLSWPLCFPLGLSPYWRRENRLAHNANIPVCTSVCHHPFGNQITNYLWFTSIFHNSFTHRFQFIFLKRLIDQDSGLGASSWNPFRCFYCLGSWNDLSHGIHRGRGRRFPSYFAFPHTHIIVILTWDRGIYGLIWSPSRWVKQLVLYSWLRWVYRGWGC